MQNIEEQKMQRKGSNQNLHPVYTLERVESHMSELEVKERERNIKRKIKNMFMTD